MASTTRTQHGVLSDSFPLQRGTELKCGPEHPISPVWRSSHSVNSTWGALGTPSWHAMFFCDTPSRRTAHAFCETLAARFTEPRPHRWFIVARTAILLVNRSDRASSDWIQKSFAASPAAQSKRPRHRPDWHHSAYAPSRSGVASPFPTTSAREPS